MIMITSIITFHRAMCPLAQSIIIRIIIFLSADIYCLNDWLTPWRDSSAHNYFPLYWLAGSTCALCVNVSGSQCRKPSTFEIAAINFGNLLAGEVFVEWQKCTPRIESTAIQRNSIFIDCGNRLLRWRGTFYTIIQTFAYLITIIILLLLLPLLQLLHHPV